jgi:hypothetical protein
MIFRDVNNDGIKDLVVIIRESNRVEIYRGR